MLATVLVWNKFVQLSHNYPPKAALKIPLLVLQNKMDLISFRKWQNKGIMPINDLFNNDKIKTFPDLQKEYRLPNPDLYLYL